jgi:L-threonylcarbamoyladenylate synthase
VLRRKVPAIASRGVASTTKKAQLAPGLLARHYSPRTPVVLHERLALADAAPPDEAFVFLRKPAGAPRAKNIFWLDPRGDLRGAAQRLFATLRELDAKQFRRIHIELAPGDGLAAAINDRLRRAAAR